MIQGGPCWQPVDQGDRSAGCQAATVEVEQIDAVVVQQVRFNGLPVVSQEAGEAEEFPCPTSV